MEVAQQYIRSQYSTLANGNLKSISKAQLYYSIITIKTDHPALANEYQSLYKDVKMFIEAYADELSCMDYGYDQPNTDKLEKVCENLTNAQQRSILNIVYIRYSQYNDVVKWVKLYKSKNAIRFSCEKFKWYNPWSWIDILANLVLCNWGSIIIFLLILFILICIVLLPAPSENLTCIEFTKQCYSDNFVIDHAVNVLYALFHIGEDVNIQPINTCGVILIVAYRILIILFIVNILYNKLLDLIPFDNAK